MSEATDAYSAVMYGELRRRLLRDKPIMDAHTEAVNAWRDGGEIGAKPLLRGMGVLAGGFGVDVVMQRSIDGGETWHPPIDPTP